MSELFSAVTSEMYESACTWAQYLDKRGVERGELWRHLGRTIALARKEYRKKFVDWFSPRHVEQAQRELADAIIADLWEAD